MGELSSFPLMLASEFESGCRDLAELFARTPPAKGDWLSADTACQKGTTYLRITTTLTHTAPIPGAPDAATEAADEVEEEDEAALVTATTNRVLVEYDITLSPSYQVPVLYFRIRDSSFRFPPTMETLYHYIIPSHFKAQAAQVGVIGGITVTDHPIINTPAFFIHPCQTACVLKASADNKPITPGQYLMLWIGAMCSCVGLNVPMNLAANNRGSPE